MLNVLEDLIPAKYRKYVVYILIPFAVLVYGGWQASAGDWTAFWPALVPAIIGWLVAAPNTHPEDEAEVLDPVPPFSPYDQPHVEAPPVVPDPSEVREAQANAVADESPTVDGVDAPTEEEM